MSRVKRKIAFVLAASDHGTMIVNRFDYRLVGPERGFGVGYQVLQGSSFDPQEVDLVLNLLGLRRKYFGDGVVAIDCGANIGVHTVEWSRQMTGWGSVIAIEAQERVFHALAGNIAINNCFNARPIHAAVAAAPGSMRIPQPDYLSPGSFGSLELRQKEKNEFIGQAIDYSKEKLVEVGCVSIDSFALPRVDLIKIDVEGMELDVLQGAQGSIVHDRPILLVEHIKSDKVALQSRLRDFGYEIFAVGLNALAVHPTDQCLGHLQRAPATPAGG
jgi:FkbM family methyltransferase